MLTWKQEEDLKWYKDHPDQGLKDAVRQINQLWSKKGSRVRISVYLTKEINGNSKKKTAIQQAISEYSKKTCIDFVIQSSIPREHHIRFINSNGCYSLLGKQTG